MKHRLFLAVMVITLLLLTFTNIVGFIITYNEYKIYGSSYTQTITINGQSQTITVNVIDKFMSMGFIVWLELLSIWSLLLVRVEEEAKRAKTAYPS